MWVLGMWIDAERLSQLLLLAVWFLASVAVGMVAGQLHERASR